VLEAQPGSIFALSQLVQALVKQGKQEESREVLEKLLRQSPRSADLWSKMLDACHYVGDDAAAVRVVERIERENHDAFDLPQVAHLAAAALARTGDEKKAEKLWKLALKKEQGMTIAYENLLNLKQPPHERHPAWALSADQWLPMPWMQQLVAATRGARDEVSVGRRLTAFAQKTPGFVEVFIPILMERADPLTRAVVVLICKNAGYYDRLRSYALSEYGPDSARMDAAMILAQAEILPVDQPVRMYMHGKWQEVQLQGYEIDDTPEPDKKLPKGVQRLLEETHALLSEGRFEEAEEKARAGLELFPDYYVFLNFLGSALQGQRRHREMEEVVKHTVEVHPDYLFARAAMATLAVERGDFEEAEEWLKPLEKRRKFHTSEFGALMAARIQIAVARKDKASAQQWLAMLESVYPDAPQLETLRRRVDGRKKLLF
jgi:tetratricopeptide (TPR) repeat protein